MADYRVYCFDGIGHVWAADSVIAASDQAAIEFATTIDGSIKTEVWQGARLVATLERGAHGSQNASSSPLR